ncbi:hypothetical protein MANES_14G023575v8 [Manihot esculenta]|uniref:Uncharacterized protein n=1 Tax=Manihot esculenta TaxID=3983 RepID=A0ACB7GFV9_MANES|nr:hypothetical protein MANES_14G023575v8 [Manihot esculenta]
MQLFSDWFVQVYNSVFASTLHMVIMVVWVLRENRNVVVWKHKRCPSHVVIRRAKSLLQYWEAARSRRELVVNAPGCVQWKKPPIESFKLNVDAALFLHQAMGVDCVLRGGNGEFIATRQQRIHNNFDTSTTETMAFRESLN